MRISISKSRKSWSNASGSVTVRPNHYSYPAGIEEIQAEVSRAAEEFQCLRVAGSGSALSPLCWTDENLLSLERFHGIETLDIAARRLWVRAGTRLGWLARALADRGLALANWRGAERQTLGGALTTGIHSGGAALQSLSAQIIGLRMVFADGSVQTLSAESRPELFDAARLALGALGVITHAELQCVPAFRLRVARESAPLASTLTHLDRHNRSCRAFSFTWQAYSGRAHLHFLHETDEPTAGADPLHDMRDQMLRGARDWLLSQAAQRLPGAAERAAGLLPLGASAQDNVVDPHTQPELAGSAPRQTIEYAVARAALPEVLTHMERVIRALRFPALLPVAVRFAAADPLWLSPQFQRDSAIVTVSAAARADAADYFAAMTEIFDRHDGRPSWAAQHDKTAVDLVRLYPRFNDFLKLRQQLDPRGVFLNPHLMSLFGVEAI
jgi:FAD/FMN-containing dehydrogenase